MVSRIDQFLALIEAWKAKDLERVLDSLHEDIVWHFAAAAAPPIRGKAQARRFLTRFAAEVSEVRWRLFDYAQSNDRLFVEGVDEYDSKAGVRIAAPYAGVIEFKDDLVIGWRDYVDVGVIARQRAGEAVSDQVEALIERPAVGAGLERQG
jgi:limonene-1,2-epoxide hydrolase